MAKNFPKDFLWGVAYASHQVEGNNKGNDWWNWEERGKTRERSGWACDSWNRYPIDHNLAEELGCGGFRLSLEWWRIEPEKDSFSKEAIEHYRRVLQNLKKKGIKRVVTLWHWTSPMWFVEEGGWHGEDAVGCFTEYCQKVIDELGDEIDVFITLNEPTIPLNKGYLAGIFPPGKRNPLAFRKARKKMIEAHGICYDIVKEKKKEIPVGITQFCNTFEAGKGLGSLRGLVKKFENAYNWGFMKDNLEKHDFWGIDYYATFVFGLKPPFITRKTTENRWTDMEWGIYPQGIYEICMQANAIAEKPVYIFENGLADAKDKYRASFIKEHLAFLEKTVEEGVDVRGYFHWSLLDNFEWNQGYQPKFGLCAINPKTMERLPRESFYRYQEMIAEYKKKSEDE